MRSHEVWTITREGSILCSSSVGIPEAALQEREAWVAVDWRQDAPVFGGERPYESLLRGGSGVPEEDEAGVPRPDE